MFGCETVVGLHDVCANANHVSVSFEIISFADSIRETFRRVTVEILRCILKRGSSSKNSWYWIDGREYVMKIKMIK